MKPINIPVKGLFNQILISGFIKVIGDPFLYAVKSDKQFVHLLHHILDMIDEIIDDRLLISMLYDCDETHLYDVIVRLKKLFDKASIIKEVLADYKNTEDLRLLHVLREVLIRRTSQISCHRMRHQLIDPIVSQIMIEATRILINKYLTRNTFIVIDSFDCTMLYHTNKYVKGFIVNTTINKKDSMIAEAYDISLIHTSHRFKNHDFVTLDGKQQTLLMYHEKPIIKESIIFQPKIIKVYLDVVNLNQAMSVNLKHYQGFYIESEYMLITKGLMIHEKEAYEDYSRLFKYIGKEFQIYLKLPQFTDDKQLMIQPSFRTEVHRFSILHESIKHWVSGVAKAIKMYQPQITLIIPNINDAKNLLFWEDEINVFKALAGEYVKIQSGILIETEAALQYCEDFKQIDTAIFNFSDLVREYVYEDGEIDMEYLISDLKTAHYIYRVKQPTKHLITNLHVDMLLTLINRGFRDFIVRSSCERAYLDIIKTWEQSRGKYKKIKQ